MILSAGRRKRKKKRGKQRRKGGRGEEPVTALSWHKFWSARAVSWQGVLNSHNYKGTTNWIRGLMPHSDHRRVFGAGIPASVSLSKLWLRLNLSKKPKWRCRGSNPGPHACQACALPLSYPSPWKFLSTGFSVVILALLTCRLCNDTAFS